MIRPLTEKEQLEYRREFLKNYLNAIKKEYDKVEEEYQKLIRKREKENEQKS